MAESLCILVRKPPYGTIHAAEALRHAGGALKSSLKVNLVMIDDGVYLAKDWQQSADSGWVNLSDALKRLIAQASLLVKNSRQFRVCVQGSALPIRGLSASSLIPGVSLVSDAEMAGLLASADGVMVY